MAYIYKITNPENNKVYIGKTVRDYKERWKEHKRDRNKEPYKNWHLYRMLNRVGPENVIWEVIEENIPNDKVEEREKYWISYYDSFKNGYNETSGGANGTKYDYEEVLTYWLNEGKRNFVQTAKYFNANESTINYIIKSFGYSSRTPAEVAIENSEKKKRSVNQIDLSTGEVLRTFNSLSDASIYLSNCKDLAKTISSVASGRRPSYKGYGWQYTEDIGKPIILNKQIKSIYLPEYDLLFENALKAAQWFIKNNLTRSKNPRQVEASITYAIHHSGYYQKVKIEQKEKIIYTYYKENSYDE